MHLMEQWIPGNPGTRYPPSLQIDMPQPSQLPRGDPTLPDGICLSTSNESVVSVGFIASPKIAMPSFVIVYASPATVCSAFTKTALFVKRTISQDESPLQNPLWSCGILGSRPVAPAYLFRVRSKLSIAQRHRKAFP